MLRSHQVERKTRGKLRTIRIDEDINYRLESLGRDVGLTINYLVNQAIRKFVEWDVFADRLRFITITSDIFERLLGYATEDQARELGGWFGKNLAKDFVVFLFKRLDVEPSVRALELLGPRYGKTFRLENTDDGQLTKGIMNHGLGRKASLLYGEAVKTLLRDLVNTQIDVELSEHQIVLKMAGPNPFPVTGSPPVALNSRNNQTHNYQQG